MFCNTFLPSGKAALVCQSYRIGAEDGICNYFQGFFNEESLVQYSFHSLHGLSFQYSFAIFQGGGMKLKSMASTYDKVDEKDAKRREKEAKKKEKEEAKADKQKGLDSSKPAIDAPIPQDEQFIERITNDDREEEMNKNMNDVSHMLHSMKAMGTDMYTEISRQNADIERIKTKADIMDDQTNLANKRAQKIVRDQ